MPKNKTLSLPVIVLFIGVFAGFGRCAEYESSINCVGLRPGWQKGVVRQRPVVFADNAEAWSEARFRVAAAGRYQLIAYLYHDWVKYSPRIYSEAVDSLGKLHQGSHTTENIWYLEPQERGRWFFVGLTDNPYWNLPAGELKVRFHAGASKEPWSLVPVPMEGRVAVAYFFLVPVMDSDSGSYLPWMQDLEAGSGDWQVRTYDRQYSTNLIQTGKKNAVFSVSESVPVSGYYTVLLPVIAKNGGSLEVAVTNGSRRQKKVLRLQPGNEWRMLSAGRFKLSNGSCRVDLRNLAAEEVAIDFLMLAPGPSAEAAP